MKPVIEIIVNKNWEVEPFLAAMTNEKLRPAGLPQPYVLLSPRSNTNRMASCRAEYHLSNINVIIRCIEDLMDPDKNASSSDEKYRVLPNYIKADKPTLVISVSTAESTPDIQPKDTLSENGSVFVGGAFYLFDARSYDAKTQSHLDIPDAQKFMGNNVKSKIYSLMDKDFCTSVAAKFTPAKYSPANEIKCAVDPEYVSVGVVNVTNYSAYTEADPAAYNAFKQTGMNYPAATIETTHGIARMACDNLYQTLFVSPITDRYKHFDDDVDKEGEQNRIAANNAGIVVAELLMKLNGYYQSND